MSEVEDGDFVKIENPSSVEKESTKIGEDDNISILNRSSEEPNEKLEISIDTISPQNAAETSSILRNRSSPSKSSKSVEIEMSPKNIPHSDPLNLLSFKIPESELKELKKTKKKLLKFYLSQNELIDSFLFLSSPDTPPNDTKVKIAIYGSIAANILLFALQLAAAVLSGSLAIFAAMADAFMDLLSGAILLSANYLAAKSQLNKYPSGSNRYETVGIIVFGSLMSTVSLQLLINGISSLISGPEKSKLDWMSISFVGVALLTKFILFLYCRLVKNPTAQVLAQDHRNDIFVNGFGLTLAILAYNFHPMLDPIGACIVALLILSNWSKTVLEHCQLLVGKIAESSFLNTLTYIALTHDERICGVDTVRAYYGGSKYIVEIDIVFPPTTQLQLAHDLGESLQEKLERLPNVERAFVHCDYETTHKPEHRKKL